MKTRGYPSSAAQRISVDGWRDRVPRSIVERKPWAAAFERSACAAVGTAVTLEAFTFGHSKNVTCQTPVIPCGKMVALGADRKV